MMAVPVLPASSSDGHQNLDVFPEGLKGRKVLLCTESFGPVNGVSRTTLMLVNHLRANGCQVAVVAPHNSTRVNTFIPKVSSVDASRTDSDLQNESTSNGNIEVRVHGYPVPFNPELSIAYVVRLSALYARTFDGPPDLIYLASPASLGFQVMLQLRQRAEYEQIPIICNFQTDLAGYCKTLFPYPLGDLADRTFASVQSFLFRHQSVKTIFYPSTYVRKYLECHRVPGEKMEILTRGVDADLFHPDKRSPLLRSQLAPAGEIVLVCVARLAAEKNFDFLACAARELDARGLNFKLYIVGGNREWEVENEIKDLFSDLTRKDKVVFAGFKLGEALAEAYASADIFLHCSISETFGLVVLESFASGVPVVARDQGGPSDTVRDGVSGFLTPPDDLSAFVDRVILLANNESMRMRFREAALKQARQATWSMINNKVAWRILDTIQKREIDLRETQDQQVVEGHYASTSAVPIFGWLLLNDTIRETVVRSRLTGALGVILGFWGLVGVYLGFTKATRWLRGKLGQSNAVI